MSETHDHIHVLDDDESVRIAIRGLLTASGYLVHCYESPGEFLVADTPEAPGCLLLALEMAGVNGLQVQRILQRQGRHMPIVFMSAYRDVPRTVQAFKQGASDFLLKPIDPEWLFAAVETALAADRARRAALSAQRQMSLSDRERTVLLGIVGGRINREIAAELGLSERTIKSCRAALMRRLGADSLADLMRVARPLLADPASIA
jgi:FixJ family two-component response regulator